MALISSLCEELDRTLPLASMRPEDTNVSTTLIRPLEDLLASTTESPNVPEGPAGMAALCVWNRLHPESADTKSLMEFARNEVPVVRFAALDAIKATVEIQNSQWREPGFAAWARQSLQDCLATEASSTVAHLIRDVLDTTAKLARPPRRARTQVRANPYTAGAPVKDGAKFFGRQDVLDQIGTIFGGLDGAKSLVLFGTRRSGKTSILLRIKGGILGKSFLPVYVDMQGFAGVDANIFLKGMCRAAINAASESGFSFEARELPPTNDTEFRIALQEQMKGLLREIPLNVLILIDEYEVLLDYIKTDSTLALQIQHLVESESNLFFIFAGSHPIEFASGSASVPLLESARYLKINFLKHDDALALVTRPSEGVLTFGPGVPDRVVDLTAGHPFFTQILCQLLFEIATPAGGKVENSHVDAAVAAFLRDSPPHVVLTWNGLKVAQKVAGSTLAVVLNDSPTATSKQVHSRLELEGYPAPPAASEIQLTLAELSETSWVAEERPEGSWRFTMELLRRWVMANRSVAALVAERKEELAGQVAPRWRQFSASMIDAVASFLALTFAGALTSFAFISSTFEYGVVTGVILAALIYFVLPMMAGRFTIGLRLIKLQPVRTQMTPLGPWRATAYGALLILRMVIAYFTVAFAILLNQEGDTTPYLVVVAIGLIIFTADILLMAFSRLRQGLSEKLAGVVLMYRK